MHRARVIETATHDSNLFLINNWSRTDHALSALGVKDQISLNIFLERLTDDVKWAEYRNITGSGFVNFYMIGINSLSYKIRLKASMQLVVLEVDCALAARTLRLAGPDLHISKLSTCLGPPGCRGASQKRNKLFLSCFELYCLLVTIMSAMSALQCRIKWLRWPGAEFFLTPWRRFKIFVRNLTYRNVIPVKKFL